jgi:RNA polymerase sigma-70 factor (ECF subfamily)
MDAQPEINDTDRDLIAAVLAHGNEQAFRELYRRHTPRLLGFVSRLLSGAKSDSEDVVQEVWIRACERLQQFKWQSAFSTWLLGIGFNVARDSLRRRKKSEATTADRFYEPSNPAIDHEVRIDLERAIQMLPVDYRIVLVLHDVEGMKHHEIAERLDIPLGTTKSQLFRARKMIRRILSERNEVIG